MLLPGSNPAVPGWRQSAAPCSEPAQRCMEGQAGFGPLLTSACLSPRVQGPAWQLWGQQSCTPMGRALGPSAGGVLDVPPIASG